MRPDDPPTDEDDLVRRAADRAAPTDQRDAAYRALLPTLHRLARLAVGRQGARDPATVDELVSWLTLRLEQGQLPTDVAGPLAWCQRVLRNRFLDLRRRRAEEALPDAALARDDGPRLEQALDAAAPFGPADLRRVRGWDARRRVLLLTRGLLWRKVAADEWDGWTAGLGLGPPFPPDGFDDWPEDRRHAHLAAALGMPLNTLHQCWRRWKGDLDELDFVRGLRPAGELCHGSDR
jgi:DNA-directed RNA polymerase specialized sigma24 family protein